MPRAHGAENVAPRQYHVFLSGGYWGPARDEFIAQLRNALPGMRMDPWFDEGHLAGGNLIPDLRGPTSTSG
jgi:hypothetical protein